MKKILFAVLGLTASTVYGNRFGDCVVGCGKYLGQCIATTFDIETCLKETGTCAGKCASELKVDRHTLEKVERMTTHARKSMGQCQKNCGIEYAQCLVTSFDLKSCTQKQAACAIGCFKSEKVEHKAPVVEVEVKNEFSVCQKNCAIEYGQCLVTTFDLKSCTQKEAACAIGCLGKLNVEKKNFDLSVKSEFSVCQKNCAIDYAKCLVTKFDFKACTQEQASCAIGCLGKLETQTVKKSPKNHHHPSVKSLKCSACKFAAGKIEGIINKYGCGLADTAMTAACEAVFLGPEDPLSEVCAAGFIAACPTLLHWIENKAFSTDKACALIRMC